MSWPRTFPATHGGDTRSHAEGEKVIRKGSLGTWMQGGKVNHVEKGTKADVNRTRRGSSTGFT